MNKPNSQNKSPSDEIASAPPAALQQPQSMAAFVVPVGLFGQMIELIRGNACHRDAEPVMQQVAQMTPQEVTLRHD